MALLVRLYDLGEISGARAAEIPGISRRAFLQLLDDYGVSECDEDMPISEEASRG